MRATTKYQQIFGAAFTPAIALAVSAIAALLVSALVCGEAVAQTYPVRPIRLVVPYPPGGATDVVARTVATLLGERVGQSVIVDNKPGGNTLIGGQAVATAAPDGYTLLFVGGASLSSVFNKNPPFDMWKDLQPVAPLYQGSYFLFVSSAMPVTSLPEFVAYAKARPGVLNFGASGPGTMLAMEAFKAAAGVDITYVPYKGSSQVTQALASNEIQTLFDAMASNRAMLQAGRIKVLASGGNSRAKDDPTIPTLRESGYPGIVAVFNGGVWAPAKTPTAIVDRLNRELQNVLRSPEYLDRLQAVGAEARTGSPEDFGRTIKAELDFWRGAAERAHYVPD